MCTHIGYAIIKGGSVNRKHRLEPFYSAGAIFASTSF